jgi:hypothetical protein
MKIEFTLDCNDLDLVAGFWAETLRCEQHVTVPGAFVSLTPLDGALNLSLQRVDEPKRVKNRMHPDLLVEDLDGEVVRLEALGARKLTGLMDEYGARWYVMSDPEGNEFCLAAMPAAESRS